MVRVHREHVGREERPPQDGFSWNEVPPWAMLLSDKQDLIINMLQNVLGQQEYMMGTYKDLGDAIARNSSASDSILQMVTTIVQELKDAQASNDPKAIDTAIANLDANTQRLVAAAVKSTPVDTAPPGQPLPPAPPESGDTGFKSQ